MESLSVYKRSLRWRVALLALMMLAAWVLVILDMMNLPALTANDTMRAFHLGLAVGLSVVGGVVCVRSLRALHNQERLYAFQREMHDERKIAIRAKCGYPVVPITSACMVLAGCMLGYQNEVVFHTLLVAALCQLVVCCALKLYYTKTM